MAFVSVTRLRVRKLSCLAPFGIYTLRSYIQAWRAQGSARILLLRDRKFTFWTITVWNTPEAMRAFRNSGVHLQAMKHLAEWCDEATYVHWTQESDERPELKLACDRLFAEGVVSRVLNPSPDHAERKFQRPKWA